MKYIEVKLKDVNPKIKSEAVLNCYIPDNFQEFSSDRKRRAMLIIPGGGYSFVSEREAEPIALRLIGEDIASFVLKYTIGPYEDEIYPLNEVYASILYIKSHAEELHILKDKVGVIGFSAGGHLAGTSVICADEYLDYFSCTKEDLSYNVAVLCYPVITMEKELTHEGTMYYRTLGKADLIEKYSVEKHVDNTFPPTFLWATSTDKDVPPYNSIILAKELVKNNVEVEFHLYPCGKHGLSLANEIVNTPEEIPSSWVKEAIRFIKAH